MSFVGDVEGKVISYIFSVVDRVGADFVASTYQKLASYYSPLFYTLAGIYLGFWFLQAKRGHYSFNDFPIVILRMVIILTLALNYSYFYRFIYDVFTNSPLHICQAITIKDGVTQAIPVVNALDSFLNNGQLEASKMLAMGSWKNPTYFIFGIFIFVMVFLSAGIAASILVLAKCLAAILLALSPIFIFCALFDSTRGLFDTYIRQLITYALIPIMTAAVLMIILSVSHVMMDIMKERNASDFASVLPLSLICIIQIYLLLQVRSQCAALAGGFTLPGVISTLRGVTANLFGKAQGVSTSTAKMGSLIFNGPSSFHSNNKGNTPFLGRSVSMSFNNRYQIQSKPKSEKKSKPETNPKPRTETIKKD